MCIVYNKRKMNNVYCYSAILLRQEYKRWILIFVLQLRAAIKIKWFINMEFNGVYKYLKLIEINLGLCSFLIQF